MTQDTRVFLAGARTPPRAHRRPNLYLFSSHSISHSLHQRAVEYLYLDRTHRRTHACCPRRSRSARPTAHDAASSNGLHLVSSDRYSRQQPSYAEDSTVSQTHAPPRHRHLRTHAMDSSTGIRNRPGPRPRHARWGWRGLFLTFCRPWPREGDMQRERRRGAETLPARHRSRRDILVPEGGIGVVRWKQARGGMAGWGGGVCAFALPVSAVVRGKGGFGCTWTWSRRLLTSLWQKEGSRRAFFASAP
jgi:hypothetical protein